MSALDVAVTFLVVCAALSVGVLFLYLLAELIVTRDNIASKLRDLKELEKLTKGK